MKVIYEKHPITQERKAELIKQGYKIIDAKFKPSDYIEETPQEKPKRKPRAKKAK